MRVDAFDFHLPEDLIALRPARPRDSARLLHVGPEGFEDVRVHDAARLLREGDVLVLNTTRVIPAALRAVRPARGPDGRDVAVRLNLHTREGPDRWRAFARPARRLAPGDVLRLRSGEAQVEHKGEAGEVTLRFPCAGAALDALIATEGEAPLPPYIADRRPADNADLEDYQTVFAREPGSVAAPTAGLHFTPALLDALQREAGVEVVTVTLHVGPGTFLPVKAAETDDHRMHAEWRSLSAEAADAINAAKAGGRRIVAVGTTALRTLESAVGPDGRVGAVAGPTDLFITPGFRFRVGDGLWTNFHLPRSTLFMLVCAFAGTDLMRAAYSHAIAQRYRFYSYGDASLLWRRHG